MHILKATPGTMYAILFFSYLSSQRSTQPKKVAISPNLVLVSWSRYAGSVDRSMGNALASASQVYMIRS